VRDDVIVMRDETRNLTGKRHHLFEGEDLPSGVPTDARILEGEGARLQSLAQLSTVGNCRTKGSPPQLGETTGANRVWSEGSRCDPS
jgi:hypothetical protein